jgi:hypothetical protein
MTASFHAGCAAFREKLTDRFGAESLRWAWENLIVPDKSVNPPPNAAAIDCINQVLPRAIGIRNTKYKAILDDLSILIESPPRDLAEEEPAFYEALARAASANGFSRMSQVYRAVAAVEKTHANARDGESTAGSLAHISPVTLYDRPPDAPWWETKSLDAFGAAAFMSALALSGCFDETNRSAAQRCPDLASLIADGYVRDVNGNVFVPGITLALALAKSLGVPIPRDWIGVYKDSLQGDPLDLLPSRKEKN